MSKLVLIDPMTVLLNKDSNEYSIYDAREDIASELKPRIKNEFMKLFTDNTLYRTSKDSLDAFIKMHLKNSRCSCTVQEFKECYIKYHKKVQMYIKTLSFICSELLFGSMFHVGLFSRMCEMDLQLFKDYLEMYEIDYRFLSFDFNIKRPEIMYDMVEAITGFEKHDILFISNDKDSIKTAKSRGWEIMLATGKDSDAIKQRCYTFAGLGI